MAGIISALGTAVTIFNTVKDSNTEDKKELARDILKSVTSSKAGLIRTDGSITKLLSSYVVEPVVIVSNSSKDTDVIDKILEVNADIFSSFYLQAFDILTSLHEVNGQVAIDILGTDNSGLTRTLLKGASTYLSKEDMKDELSKLLDTNSALSIEVSDSKAGTIKINDKSLFGTTTTTGNIKEDERLNKMSSQPLYGILQRNLQITLSVKHEVTKEGKSHPFRDHTVIIPITVKMHVIYTGIDNILNMLAPNSKDKSFGYRLDEYRAGAISLTDLIFANDLIKQYKDNKLKDKENLLELINNRKLSANSKIVDTKAIGFEKFYNMLVVTSEDKVRLDKHIRGDITSEKYKQDLLTQAYAMTCTVIDQDYERVYILTKDIRGRTDISFKALNKRKDKDVDMSEIMKALMSNRPPVF